MLFTATLAATTISACSSQKATVPQERKAVRTQMDRVYSDVTPHGLIISFDSAVGSAPLLRKAAKMKCTILHQYKNLNMVALSVPDSIDIREAITTFRKVKGVIAVERDRILHLDNNNNNIQ